MEWLNSMFGGEMSTAIQLVLITVALVVALLVLFWVFRKIAGNNKFKSSRNRQPRLAVTDHAIIDDKRQLILVRRDNVEHLLMIGGPTDVLVESGVVRVQHAQSAGAQDDPSPDLPPIAEIIEPEMDETQPSALAEPQSKDKTVIAAAAVAGSALVGAGVASAIGQSEEPATEPATETTIETIPDTAADTIAPEELAEIEANLSLEELFEDSDTVPSPAQITEPETANFVEAIENAVEKSAQEVVEKSDIISDAIIPDDVDDLAVTQEQEPVGDLEAALGAELENPSSLEDSLEAAIAPDTEAPKIEPAQQPREPEKTESSDMEDEMQRLLKELSSETSSSGS